MAGTWTQQNKTLPGAYLNIRTKEPLSITLGERGIVVILQELSKGIDKTIYTVSGTESTLPEECTAKDRRLAAEALKSAKMVLVYKLPETHTKEQVDEALETLRTVRWDVLCYPFDGEEETAAKEAVSTYIRTMREDEGVKCQAVLANHPGDSEGVINVIQGMMMSDGTELAAKEVTAWVAGATAGAGIASSNTGKIYGGAVDVNPRMTRTEMEDAVKAGKFIFKTDTAQNVTAVYDINSLVTVTPEKGKVFSKNRVVRTLDNISNDISSIFESNYIGKVNNNGDGRSLFKAALADYFNTLQAMGGIQDFNTEDVEVSPGTESDAIIVNASVRPVDSVEKIYMTINLS